MCSHLQKKLLEDEDADTGGKGSPQGHQRGCIVRDAAKENQGVKPIWQDETEEKKAQVRSYIWNQLVHPPCPAGWRNPEIPDLGRLFRVLCLSGDHSAAIGHFANSGCIHLHERITNRNKYEIPRPDHLYASVGNSVISLYINKVVFQKHE